MEPNVELKALGAGGGESTAISLFPSSTLTEGQDRAPQKRRGAVGHTVWPAVTAHAIITPAL